MLTPGQRPTWWLAWAAVPYELGARLRAYGYARGWFAQRHLPVPVISVGNLTVGGTGKTPMVIEITQWLLGAGKRVAVLSRGYRRTGRESVLVVSDGIRTLATPEQAGDEPYLIAQRCPKAVVAVGTDRYRLGRQVLETCVVDCMVLDDGFQHLGLRRDVNLLLVDATDARGLEQMLPAGRLREPIIAAKRATAIIVTRAEEPSRVDDVLARLRSAVDSLPQTAEVGFRAGELVSVATGAGRSVEWCQGKKTLLVSGIGHGASFRGTAEALGVSILEEVSYPDHYAYTVNDVVKLGERAADLKADLVLTTEKDAGKIRPYLPPDDGRWWAARLRVEWLRGEAAIRNMIMDAKPTIHEGVRA
ncbi:MAG TPA: tetraacyldisaccharide 4'-kinase [Nitrospira sp.]|nr:tetraacyldisaccharide 4'-kinase [Nitrospira sp.]